jgi:hypothetical protein
MSSLRASYPGIQSLFAKRCVISQGAYGKLVDGEYKWKLQS